MTTGEMFGRCYSISVGQNGGAGRLIASDENGDGLRITFHITKTTSTNPNTSEITVFNLAPATRALLEKPDTVIEIHAGYKNASGNVLMHKGNVVFGYSRRRGPDIETIFQLADGHQALRDTMISLAMHKGGKASDAVKQITAQLGLGISQAPGLLERTWEHGFSYYGPAKSAMRQVTTSTGLEWSVQNHVVQVLNKGGTTSKPAVLISPTSGLIYSPERLREGSQAAASVVNQDDPSTAKQVKYLIGQRLRFNGWRIRSLLMPGIGAGDTVAIKSEAVTGTFRVDKIEHRGDSHSGSWESEMDLLDPNDYAVRQAQTSQQAARRAVSVARSRIKAAKA